MTKLKDIIRKLCEEAEEPVEKERLFYDDHYLERVAEGLGYNTDFNKAFWGMNHMPKLYHCTTPQAYDSIKTQGLKMKRHRRGAISNRHVGPAVFTTMEELEVDFFKSYYGPIVLIVNAQQMKDDGFTPYVEMEPDWYRARMLEFVLNRLGDDQADASLYVDSSDQNTEGTVIIYSDIPVKYLSLANV